MKKGTKTMILKTIGWAAQRNLSHEPDRLALKTACEKHGVRYEEFIATGFGEMPFIDASDNPFCFDGLIPCGTQQLMTQLADHWLVFFDDVNFSVETCIAKYGAHAVNHAGKIINYTELAGFASGDWFVRPNQCTKKFNGGLYPACELQGLVREDNTPWDGKVLVSEPIDIETEWRLFVVDREVVAGSQYRSKGTLKVEANVPAGVSQFAGHMCEIWTPCDLFVIDVCLVGGNYYVVELNAFNCAGFYASDVDAIVRAVARHFEIERDQSR
jgi:hypothetical protein